MVYTLDGEPELCPEPATIEHGEVEYSSRNVSSIALYECNTGYKLRQRYNSAECVLLTNPKRRAVWSYWPGHCEIGKHFRLSRLN